MTIPDITACEAPNGPVCEAAKAPNGPAQLLTDAKAGKFRLDYNGAPIFQGSVKIRRAGAELSLKDAAARLFVLSKYDGWDVVTQTIRVGVIGALGGDVVILKGAVPATVGGMLCGPDLETGPPEPVEAGATAFYCLDHDWLLSVDTGAEGSFWAVESGKTKAEFAGDIVLRFLPWLRLRHCGVSE